MNEEPKDYEFAVCPYCKKEADCEHLFAVYDAIDNYFLDGYLVDKMEPMIEKVREFFRKHLADREVREDIFEPQDDFFEDSWANILENIEYYTERNEAYDIESIVTDYEVTHLVFCALTLDPVKAYEPMGPFLGLTYSFYTDEDHKEYYDLFLNRLLDYYLEDHTVQDEKAK